MNLCNLKMALVGQGYVGLPLAIEFDFNIDISDHEANTSELKEEFAIHLVNDIYDGIILAVSRYKFSMRNIESLKKSC